MKTKLITLTKGDKGDPGKPGAGGMIMCDSFEELSATTNVDEGTLGATRGKMKLVEGDNISRLGLSTDVTPVFDRSKLTETQLTGGELGVLMLANSLTPTAQQPINGGLMYLASGDVDVVVAQAVESNTPIPVYASKAITLDASYGNVAFVQGWQPGMKIIDFGASTVGFSMAGVAHCDVVTNCDDVFYNQAGTPNIYVFVNGAWGLVSAQPAVKTTEIIINPNLISLNNQATSEELVTAIGGQDIMNRLWNEIGDMNTPIYIGASGLEDGGALFLTAATRLKSGANMIHLGFINGFGGAYLSVQINRNAASGQYLLTMSSHPFNN